MKINRNNRRNSERGFTIIELLIATSVFALVLTALVAGVVYINNTYFAGVIRSKTQNVSRNVVNTAAQSIQFGGATPQGPFTYPLHASDYPTGAPAGSLTLTWYCIGNEMFSFVPGEEYVGPTTAVGNQSNYGLLVTQLQNSYCPPSSSGAVYPGVAPTHIVPYAPSQTPVQELGTDMRVVSFSLAPTDSADPTAHTWQIQFRVAFGNDNRYTAGTEYTTSPICAPKAGSTYCFITNLSTVVQQRVYTSGG